MNHCSKTVVLCVKCVQNGERKLVVSVYVKQVVKASIRVEFDLSSLAITFQTRFVVFSMVVDN